MANERDRTDLINKLRGTGRGDLVNKLQEASNQLRDTAGADKVQTADLGGRIGTARGKSGARKNLITQRAIQTGGAGDGVKRQRGRSTLEFEQRDTIGPDIRKRFRESPGFFAGEQVTKSTTQILREKEQAGVGELAGVRPPQKMGGTTRPAITDKQKATSLSSFTDIGKFKKGGKTLRELADKKGAGVFTERGISELFGSAADLAKLFASPEFQQRKARGIQVAAGAKGRRADVKARSDQITALSGVLEDLSVSGGDNEALINRIQEQIQSLIAGGDGGGITPGLVGKLAQQFDDNQIKTILGIIR